MRVCGFEGLRVCGFKGLRVSGVLGFGFKVKGLLFGVYSLQFQFLGAG